MPEPLKARPLYKMTNKERSKDDETHILCPSMCSVAGTEEDLKNFFKARDFLAEVEDSYADLGFLSGYDDDLYEKLSKEGVF